MAKGRKTGGRKKGKPNKLTVEIKAAWDDAIAHCQGKEGKSLSDWAEANQDKFWPLTMQMVPKELKLDAVVSIAEALTAARQRATRTDQEPNG